MLLNLLIYDIFMQILRNLNATDLCLASCVWSDLASDEFLWQKLVLDFGVGVLNIILNNQQLLKYSMPMLVKQKVCVI